MNAAKQLIGGIVFDPVLDLPVGEIVEFLQNIGTEVNPHPYLPSKPPKTFERRLFQILDDHVDEVRPRQKPKVTGKDRTSSK